MKKIKVCVLDVTMPDGEKFKQYMLEGISGKSLVAPTFSSLPAARKWAKDNKHSFKDGN